MPAHARLPLLSLAVMALVAACAAPAAKPSAEPGTTAPESAVTAPAIAGALPTMVGPGPAGRLLVLRPAGPDTSAELAAVDTFTGEWTTLWPVFDVDELGYTAHDWAVAPDGRQIAYLKKGGDGQAVIIVRDLTPGSPRHDFPAADGTGDVLLWLPDGGLAYGALEVSNETGVGGLATLERWTLRRLDPATGHDEPVVSLDKAQLGERFARLAGYDPAAGRAALLLGPGENFFVDTIRLLDTATGATVADLRTMDEGFTVAVAPDGRAVAYGECQGCNAGGLGAVKVLVLATGPEDVARLRLDEKVVGLRWRPDGQGLAWTTYHRGTEIPGERHAVGLAESTTGGWRPLRSGALPGSALAWSPDGASLLTNEALVKVSGEPGVTAPPWGLPDGVMWDEAAWRVIGWVPATDGGAAVGARGPRPDATTTPTEGTP